MTENAQLERADMPSMIVFSDMQFNEAASCDESPMEESDMEILHESIRDQFHQTASRLGWKDKDSTPLVYWNVRNTGGHPVDKSTEGTVLLSGFSPSLLKLVMNGEALHEEVVAVVQMDGSVVETK